MQRNHALLDMDLPFHKMGLAHFTCTLLSWDGIGTNDELLNSITDSEYAELFERVAASGMGVELNMSAAEASNEANLRIYRIARERGCKFYLGSDAHTPTELSRAMTKFRAIVDALGLTEDDKHPFIAR
jgi:histidinol phosphatase-like PHP family hydrolase